ncbi:MAG: hypothetical protein FK730_00750 [Asgard group archaeon]|nr:hypothetical protein [Asgard group archaeon]
MSVTKKPKWWFVFLTDLRVRLSRFRFLGKFRYFMPFIMLGLIAIQFIVLLIYTRNITEPLIDNLDVFIEDWILKIDAIVSSFIFFMAFNSSIDYFTRYTEISEIEIISGSPISSRSYLFGKFLSIQLNNFVFIPIIILLHIELAIFAAVEINWLYLFFFSVAITVLMLSVSWLGITIGPKALFRMKKSNIEDPKKKSAYPFWLGLIISIQFFAPMICAISLEPDIFERVFQYIPYGWFGIIGNEIFNPVESNSFALLFGFLAIFFGLIFVIFAYYRTRFSLNLEDFEAVSSKGITKNITPWGLRILNKVPLPYKYSIKTFYLINQRKSLFNRISDIFFILVTIGVFVLGFVIKSIDWSTYIFFGSIAVGYFLMTYASIDGIQILLGGRNVFLISKSAPKGIRKMFLGKIMQIMISYIIEIICICILLFTFHQDRIIALLMTITVISAIFNGIVVGLFALSIAPFFETADLTSNPLRGLQLALPMNVSMGIIAGVVITVITFLGLGYLWLIFLVLIIYYLLSGIGLFFSAEKLIQRYET